MMNVMPLAIFEQQKIFQKIQQCKHATRTFGDLSKREIEEIIRTGRNYDFDWFANDRVLYKKFIIMIYYT